MSILLAKGLEKPLIGGWAAAEKNNVINAIKSFMLSPRNWAGVLRLLSPGRIVEVCSASGATIRCCQIPVGFDTAGDPETY